jgi:Uma2 family endonuclease
MIASDVDQLRRNPLLVPITVDQYHQMIARGILEEGAPIELIDGLLVEKDRRAYVPGQPPGGQVVPLTVEQYHEMIAVGILREGAPIELINGLLVWKDRSQRGEDRMTVGYRHALVVDELSALNELIRPHGCFLRAQQPITLTSDNEPEPDGAIVRGTPRTYAKALPTAADVQCVFEVADSSLSEDRTTKQRVYAAAGIPRYVIINLIDEIIEVHTGPDAGQRRYTNMVVLRAGGSLTLAMPDGATLDVAVERLLP